MLRFVLSGVVVTVCLAMPVRADVIVANSLADGEEHVQPVNISGADPQGSVDLTSSDLELISEGDNGLDWQVVGLQYASLGIARFSTINSASITFTVDPGEVDLPGNLELSIFGHLSPNSATLSANNFDLTSRLRTTARVDWDFSTTNPATGAPYTVGQTIATPNLAPIIQEIVNQAGWDPNNQLTLLIVPDAYLANPNGAAIALPEIEIASRDLPNTPSFSPLRIEFTAVPEPGSMIAILFVGGVTCIARHKRFRKSIDRASESPKA